MKTIKLCISATILLVCTQSLWAYDFYAVNNGDTIYYNITSDTLPYTAEVTYKILYDSMNYSGAISIPSTVTYDTLTYTVTTIGYGAFFKNKGLTSVVLSDSIVSIGVSAFRYCISLTFVIIPNSVTSIGHYAFYGCIALPSSTLPASVRSIGKEVFSYCKKLSSITVDENNLYYKSVDGILYSYAMDTLIQCGGGKIGTLTIPNAVICIGDNAFEACGDLTFINIPTSVQTIGRYAFSLCTGLTHITIPDSVKTIDFTAFTMDTNLTTVHFNAINCNDTVFFRVIIN